MNRLLTFFLTALLAFSVGWAETATFTVSTYNTGTLVGAPSGVTASVSTTASQMGNGGSQLTNGKYFTLTLSGFTSSYKLTGITLNYCTNASSGTGTFNATLGSNQLGSYNITKVSSNGRTPRDATLSINETPFDGNDLVLSVNSTANSVYVISFTITYADNGGVTPAEPNVYRKVTSTSDLVAGKKYIIVNEASGVGMGALNSERYGTGVTGLTFDNDRVDIGGKNVMEMTLGGSSNAWTFNMGNNQYLSNTSSSSYTFFSASSVGAATADITKWTITANSSSCSIRSNYVTSQFIRYNSSGQFGTYGVNVNSAVALYVEDDGSTPTQSCAAPEFNPDGGVFTGSASVTITSATEGATIYYTTDDTDPVVSRSSIANGGTVELTESCTLKAMAVKSGMENSAIVTSQSYTITPAGGSDSKIYRKVTTTDELVPGQKYIIMLENGSSSVGMGAYDGSKHFNGVQNLVISNNRVDIANTSVLELTLGGTTGAWTLYTGNGYIQGADAVQFNIEGDATANNSKWIITNTVNNTDGFVVENAQYARYIKCYSNSTFRHYNATNGAWAYLYVQETSTEPILTISPETQTISDAAPASLTIAGENVSGSINASLANNNDWYLNPTSFGNEGGTATLTYTGRALSASNTVTASASGATNVSAIVNYVADLYIVTDNGVTGDWHFDGTNGVPMTNNNGVYTAIFTATNPNTFILFARKTGNDVTWNTRYVFGPNSNGDWWLPISGNGNGSIDLSDDDPIKIQGAGIYTITIDANAGTFTITKLNINVTIAPEDGTHFTGSTISGTITSDPAGTIEWSTDGTNWQTYTDGFTATVGQVGGSVTVYARSTYNGVTSDVATATYTRDLAPAPAAPNFSMGSSAVAVGTVITITAPEGCTLYVDGQQVTNPYDVTIDHGMTITAYCVNDEGTPSATVTNIYTIAAVCNAEIVFKDSDSDATSATNWDRIGGEGDDNYFEAGKDYLVGASDISRVFKGTTGLKYGNSSNGGTITFTLNSNTEWKVSHITLNAKNYNGNTVTFTVSTNNGQSQITSAIGNNLGGYTLDFNGTAVSSITISASARAYLKGFTITYDCAPKVEAPVITPATGTYYESQSVTMTCETTGATIYYTTDGSEPTTSSTAYNGEFTAPYSAGGTTTINAIAVNDLGAISPVTTVVYTWGIPTVTIHPDSRNTTASGVNVTLTGTPAGATIYYTTDGTTPSATNGSEYTGTFNVTLDEIGDQVTVNAIAIYGNLTSTVSSATYTRVDKVVEVNAPFFSPLQNHTYYGDQTLQIASTTPNADIYYEIVEVSGTTAPSSSTVEDPTHVSSYYDGSPIEMTVGNSYYVKAIAYIGNYASTVSEGWYVIQPFTQTGNVYQNLKDFNENCPEDVTAHLVNPVQVVYHSTYTNDGTMAEYCYVRDNTDYALIYFGKADNNDYHIFEMGDWIDGSQIAGVTSKPSFGYHIQIGTGSHEVTSWPSSTIGHTAILPEETTCKVIYDGTQDGENSWAHYVHLRYSTLTGVADESTNDMKHNGYINDQSNTALNYYDKFYRWSAGTCSYQNHTYTIHALGDYDQAFFDAKQNAGATFDVYGIVDYYSSKGFQVCPIDFLWAYKPVMTPATTTSFEPVTVNITAEHPEWAAEGVVIYYKTEDMEEWAVYTEPITVNSTTTIQAYAEVPSEKLDGTNYNDYVRSEIVTETYTIEGIVDPTISPASQVIEVVTGQESVTVTVTDHNEAGSGAVTTYTVNGVEYTLEAGQSVEIVVTETTTVTAVSSIVSGEHTLYSNEVSETYTFVEKNGVVFDLVKTAPKVGSVYVIVNKDAYMGLSTTQNDNNRGSVGVMFVEGTNKEKVYGNEQLAQFVLEEANAGRYYFKNINGGNTGYLVVTTNANANLNTSADATAYAEATVAIGGQDAGYPATITFNYDGTTRYMRYYANGRTFSTYADGSLNENVFLYGLEATPLAYIETSETPVEPREGNKQVLVSDQLIGVWAVVNPDKGINKLWAKDQGNASIDKTFKTDEQTDYVKDIWGLETKDEWDQSNWVVLDFGALTGESAFNYVSRKLESATVKGYYTDDLNYTIQLTEAPTKVDENDVIGYPGYNCDYKETSSGVVYYYNHYTPANFMTENLNEPYGDGAEAGPASSVEGMKLFFMNPKVQEIAQVWAVWMGNDRFDVIAKGTDANGNSVNGYDLSGAFDVLTWDYNRLGGPDENPDYGSPLADNANALDYGTPYLFHVIVTRNNYDYGHQRRAPGATPSGAFGIMPADLPAGHPDPTVVKDVNGVKQVESVRYYNIMGMESMNPFEGVNIVVTRFSDGSISTFKVIR